ncbi:crossover junction endodeoxyribonuclease RuvC [bacterium]|nr:crossover junction endodeoxyribonuclease RuvC [bacterium]
MIILGIDPGTQLLGFGIISYEKNHLTYLASGYLELPTGHSLPQKLDEIYHHLIRLIKKYKPKEISLENVFVHQNVKSALKLGHARGAVILAGVHLNLKICEYSPKEMKMAVVGNGNASKEQVRFMVSKLLQLSREPALDESDALGLAICHAHRMKSPRSSVKSWSEYIKQHPEIVKK